MMDYHKKITPYLDGSLSPEERSEFEAFVHTHPDFEAKLREKETEIQKLKEMMPQVSLSPESSDALDSEIRQSIFNLLKKEPRNFWEKVSDKIEEILSR